MKKIILVLAITTFAPIATAANSEVATFDFWAWAASLFASESASAESTVNAEPLLESVQDESRSFNSIIR